MTWPPVSPHEYTVATYDPRGMARSTLDDPEAGQSVAEHADDAYRLLELLSPGEPARVFGASSGGIAALHLLTTRPERVERVVVHEPPVVMVLPDAAEHHAAARAGGGDAPYGRAHRRRWPCSRRG